MKKGKERNWGGEEGSPSRCDISYSQAGTGEERVTAAPRLWPGRGHTQLWLSMDGKGVRGESEVWDKDRQEGGFRLKGETRSWN